jgi:hypothetical protein
MTRTQKLTGWTGYAGQNLTLYQKKAFDLHPVHPVNSAFDGFVAI